MDKAEQDIKDGLEEINKDVHYSDKMWRLEKEIRKSDGGGLRARWESGKLMLSDRQGKRLPNGALARYAKLLKVHPSELTARMKFAEKFPTEEQLTTVISKFQSWFDIKQKALTDTPKAKKEKTWSQHLRCARKDFQRLYKCASTEAAEENKLFREIVEAICYVVTPGARIRLACAFIGKVSGGHLTAKDHEALRELVETIEEIRTDDDIYDKANMAGLVEKKTTDALAAAEM